MDTGKKINNINRILKPAATVFARDFGPSGLTAGRIHCSSTVRD